MLINKLLKDQIVYIQLIIQNLNKPSWSAEAHKIKLFGSHWLDQVD